MSAFHWNKVKALGLPARFEATYVLHEIGCLKPAHEAFQIAWTLSIAERIGVTIAASAIKTALGV